MASEITDVEKADMQQRLEGFTTKSDKIRKLNEAGYARADIARFLDIRYQHVRNVLENDKNKKAVKGTHDPRAQPGVTKPTGDKNPTWTKVGPGGRVVIPAAFRAVLGLEEGSEVQIRLDDEEIRIVSRSVAYRRVQEFVKKYVPPGVSLVDELIADRKREAAEEERGE